MHTCSPAASSREVVVVQVVEVEVGFYFVQVVVEVSAPRGACYPPLPPLYSSERPRVVRMHKGRDMRLMEVIGRNSTRISS